MNLSKYVIVALMPSLLLTSGVANAGLFRKKVTHVHQAAGIDIGPITSGLTSLNGTLSNGLEGVQNNLGSLKTVSDGIKDATSQSKELLNDIKTAQETYQKATKEYQLFMDGNARERLAIMNRNARMLAKKDLALVLKTGKSNPMRSELEKHVINENKVGYQEALRAGIDRQYYETRDQKKVESMAEQLGVTLPPNHIEVLKEREKLYGAQAAVWNQVDSNQKIQNKRMGRIHEFNQMISDLNDQSELETLHLIAAQNQLALEQKEELIRMQNQALASTEFSSTVEANRRAKWDMNETKRRKAVKQKYANRDRGGDLMHVKSMSELMQLGKNK